jgi:hypothetical protein
MCIELAKHTPVLNLCMYGSFYCVYCSCTNYFDDSYKINLQGSHLTMIVKEK